MAEVALKGVNKVFPGNVKAVIDADLTVEDKEFVVLVGPSGCGKSTTLRMVAGLEEITAGEVYIDGRLVNDVPPKDRDIAMVFQNYALYPHMTVYRNMAFGLQLRRVPRKEIDQRVRDAASILGIGELLHRRPRELSGGQRQRVAVGRAIVRKPKVFLFDEPLSNLDAKMRVQMRVELSKLHTRLQSTMIYVTHDQTEAMTMGDRIVVMKDGVMMQTAGPIDLYEQPVNRFVGGFIGSPPMNFLEGRLTSRDGEMFFSSEGMPEVKLVSEMALKMERYAGREVSFGIRPEDIYDKLFLANVSPENTVRARVEVVEPMGSEVNLYLKIGDRTVMAGVDVHSQAQVNQELEFVFDMNKVHFFDKETEQTIV